CQGPTGVIFDTPNQSVLVVHRLPDVDVERRVAAGRDDCVIWQNQRCGTPIEEAVFRWTSRCDPQPEVGLVHFNARAAVVPDRVVAPVGTPSIRKTGYLVVQITMQQPNMA